MPILIQCPNPVCAASSSVPEALNGRGVKCKRCGTPFKATPTLDGESNETQKSKPSSSGNPFPTLPTEFGRYHVTKLLGRGGMGAVYLARDTQLGRQVALKLPSFHASETRRAERFVREAQSAAGLMHPNICPVFDAGKIDGQPFITMGYIDGSSLDALIDPDSPMDPTRAAGFARKVAAALHAAHETGIVHRDLKPANVMLTAKGEPVVMDFGLAKRVAETDANEAKLTHDGAVMGTPSYMAPEQVRGELECIGPATDVYSLGVMLFEMLTGRTPYTGPLGMVMGQILIAPVRRPSELRPDIDPRLDDACHRAMAKDPADRFPDMVTFGAALDEFLNETESVSVSLLEMAAAPKSPSWLPMSIAAGFLGLVLLVAGIMLSVKTKYGDVVIDLGDNVAGVEVKVDGARVELTGIDKPITLTAGEHGLTVIGADFETVTQSFIVKKGEKQVVKVTLKAKAVGVATVVPEQKIAEPTIVKPIAVPASVPNDSLTIGHVWVGNRTYTKGAFAPGVVPYELHIKTRDGAKFSGHIFDNGSGRNMSTIEGEVTGEAIRWTEQSTFTANMIYETTGTLSGRTIRATQVGKRGGGWTGDTALELVVADGPVKTEKGEPYVFPTRFTPLFNGKDLTGWKTVGVPKWRWENDRLLGSPATPRGAGILMTDAEYDDLEIELQYRVGVGAGSGLFLRTDPNCSLWGDGQIEVQIIDDAFPEYASLTAMQKTGSVYNIFTRKVDPPYKRGDWNALRVRLEKRQIQVWVNGTQTVDADLDSARDKFVTVPGLRRTTGRIGLQQNQKSDVEFKDVRVKRLGAKVSTNTLPEPAKPVAESATLFDGKTLLGFQAQTAWAVTGGALKSRKSGSAFTEKTYSDFTLEMEFRIEPDTMASVDILSEPGDIPAWVMLDNTRDAMAAITHNVREKGFVVHRLKPSAELKPAAEWNALTIALRDPMLSVTLNGKTLSNENIRNHLAWWRGGQLPAGKPSGRIGLTKRFGKGELLIRKLDITTNP